MLTWTLQVVPKESARLGLPGHHENIVKLNADHSTVCKFGDTQADKDNFELVQVNISDIYKSALKNSELKPTSSAVPRKKDEEADETEDMLQKRFAKLGQRS